MKKLFILVVANLIAGCSGSSNGGSADEATAANTDLTGTYIMQGIQCYDSSLTTLTNATTYSGAYTNRVVVSGNSFSETITTDLCTINIAGNIEAAGNAMTLTERRVVNATGGSCTITQTLNGSAIKPGSLSTTYSSAQTLGNLTNVPYLWNATTKTLGILSIFTDGAGGNCFIAYSKQ